MAVPEIISDKLEKDVKIEYININMDKAMDKAIGNENGCDMVVESEAVVDTCGVCGGNDDTCKRIHKSFTENVKFGYSTVGTIPRGAYHILIKENRNARNYLALKASDGSFQINSAFRLSRFGDYPAIGTTFTYDRNAGPDCPDECIRADGPIEASIDVMILAYGTNLGIDYSYSVPTYYREYGNKNEAIVPVVYIDGDVETTTAMTSSSTKTTTTAKKDNSSEIFEDAFDNTGKVTITIATDDDDEITNRTDALGNIAVMRNSLIRGYQ